MDLSRLKLGLKVEPILIMILVWITILPFKKNFRESDQYAETILVTVLVIFCTKEIQYRQTWQVHGYHQVTNDSVDLKISPLAKLNR